MLRTISITTHAPSIVIVQGAYERFCAPAETVCAMDSGEMQVSTADVWFMEAHTTLATAPPADSWLRFRRHVDEWQQQRGVMSSITEAVMCPAYQSIIGMGELAVAFILAQLESEGDDPDQWFWALKAITGADPVDAGDRGNYANMAHAWLQWGKNKGYAR